MFDESLGIIGMFLMVIFGLIGVVAAGSLASQFLPVVAFKILGIVFCFSLSGLGFYLFKNTSW